ncbi:sensor histidine kinase [Leptolyngbya sp. PCC 6406]|uniref:sensor histidine kinase n=1 Tax=Leptolyngbya sp. PCC 6406 TaxID=1173264 RepID=UPI0002AC28AA|nr:HAMP domain-containing sensor histidine kinase [Leptolyngbya sp. PCC 6406]
MSKPNLRGRLFWSHLVVMAIGIISMVTIGWLYSPRLFVVYLERIESRNFSAAQVRTQLVQGFHFAWGRSMVWAGLLGGIAASSASYWLSRRIIQPLLEMEAVTREFASGNLDRRLPAYDIQELTQLAQSVNQMATELAQVEQRRRELVSDLSHELRTPLTILKGYLEALADGTVASEPLVYQRLARETARLQRLVNDLQELSQLESGYLPIQPQSLAICPLLRSLVARFQGQRLPEDPVQIKLDCSDDLLRAWADPERIEQIVVNLLANALRYTEQGQVVVSAWSEANRVWIAVADTGVGMAPEDLDYVFDRFWRADRSRDRTSGGTGIGLTICRRLVALHGGHIEVESTVSKGSTFRFWLPKPTEPTTPAKGVQLR